MKRNNWWSVLSGVIGWTLGALVYWLWSRGWLNYLSRLLLTVAVGWSLGWWIVNR